jgi:hypothetical protein
LADFQKVECVYSPASGPNVVWANDDTLYMRQYNGSHATFGFKAVGNGVGRISITIDDDVIGPIDVDPNSPDPCATPGPVLLKPVGSSRS